jgi:hypothetical protein
MTDLLLKRSRISLNEAYDHAACLRWPTGRITLRQDGRVWNGACRFNEVDGSIE